MAKYPPFAFGDCVASLREKEFNDRQKIPAEIRQKENPARGRNLQQWQGSAAETDHFHFFALPGLVFAGIHSFQSLF